MSKNNGLRPVERPVLKCEDLWKTMKSEMARSGLRGQ